MSIFTKVKVKAQPRNLFNLSHEVKQTQDFAQLVPCYTEMIYPGDKFNASTEVLVKSLPMVAPLMHRIDVTVHNFFVPMRLICPEWEQLVTGWNQKTKSVVDRKVACFVITGSTVKMEQYCGPGTLINYLGFPPYVYNEWSTGTKTIRIPKYLLNAYAKIYNEYYRDQNLEDEIELDMNPSDTTIPADSDNVPALLLLRTRCWHKDYFTSALPSAQQGLPVNILPTPTVNVTMTNPQYPFKSNGTQVGDVTSSRLTTGSSYTGLKGPDGNLLELDTSRMKATLSNNQVTVNSLRQNLRLQQWLEKMERFGHRYAEQLFGMFGERSDDATLQRAQFLGGGKQPVVVTEIQNMTYQNSDAAPLGKQAGSSLSAGQHFAFKRRFNEHGIVISLMSIMPAAGYFQGYPRKFAWTDKNSMYWPEFAHLGEQEVKNQEIFYNFMSGSTNPNMQDFGYQSRFAEYKHNQDRVAGDFADPIGTSLFYWHLARYFKPDPKNPNSITSKVNLNKDFVHVDRESMHRCFAVISDQPKNSPFYVQIYHHIRAARKMPRYGTPTL